MKYLISLSLFVSIHLKGQVISIQNDRGAFLSDCLVIGSDGFVASLDTMKLAFNLKGLSFPIGIHCAGYNSKTIESANKLSATTTLDMLSDSLNAVTLVKRRISPNESLRRIFDNTTGMRSPPDTILQRFSYLLLSSHLDTLARMTGLVSRDIGGIWHRRVHVFYDSISHLYLDSSESQLLENMWPSSFTQTRSNNFTAMLNEERASKRQEIAIDLDSIVKVGGIFKYCFSGTNTHKALFGASHTSTFRFTGIGPSLEKAVLQSASFDNPRDSKGMKCVIKSRMSFDRDLWYYGEEETVTDFSEEDQNCPGCQEKLILKDARQTSTVNPRRHRVGYFNIWQFNRVARRDSLMQYLKAN